MTIQPPATALFDTYNARFLDPTAIARSFILPRSIFKLLCKNENSMLIGPRGSGKTHLMKMLRPSALRAWKHPEKKELLADLRFTAVYIASDSGWAARMATIRANSTEFKIFSALRDATFVVYIMTFMLDALSECSSINDNDEDEIHKFRIRWNSNLEGQISAELAKQWLLDLEFSSLRAMRFALHERLRLIDGIYFQIATLEKRMELGELTEHSFLGITAPNAISAFVTIVNELCEEPDRAWAFCFDETEILEPSYETSLLRSLRSTKDQRLRFKISASPFSARPFERDDSSVPMGGHDFTPITLTYARKHEGVRFGRHMLDALLAEAQIKTGPNQMFGQSLFEPALPHEARGERSRYQRGGMRHGMLKELERDDPAFARYLRYRKINLDEVGQQSEEERAEIRKLIQIAEIRREFGATNILRANNRIIPRHRSRKRVGDMYTGAEALLTICDGNPRWLIGIFRPLIDLGKSQGRVSRSRQARSISTAIARFLSLLSTIPYSDQRRHVPITKFIDQIGERFFSGITDSNFKTEPALSFIVDGKVTDAEAHAIGAALNQGAFVFIPSQESEHCMGDIRNKRFRVSYLLCPRYRLPLMYGQPIALSNILRTQRLLTTEQYTLSDLYR
jgi:hypothetical protein